MNVPDTLFDFSTGQKRTGRYDARGGSVHRQWRQRVLDWTYALAAGTRFTADDLIAAVGPPTADEGPGHRNATGSVFRALAGKDHHVIMTTGDYAKSWRESTRGHILTVWVRT